MYTNLINYKDSEQWLHSNWIEVYDFCHLSHYFTNCTKKTSCEPLVGQTDIPVPGQESVFYGLLIVVSAFQYRKK